MTDAAEIVGFWRDAGAGKWFARDDAFDAALRDRFLDAHMAAARGEHDGWLEDAEGALALVLLLDQIPRNIFRDTAHAFATDPLARLAASVAIARGWDASFAPDLRAFFYLPYEHAEDGADQARSLALFDALGDPDLLKWARLHADIIGRFGRFPHRNRALGRVSTPEEVAFLEGGGFSG